MLRKVADAVLRVSRAPDCTTFRNESCNNPPNRKRGSSRCLQMHVKVVNGGSGGGFLGKDAGGGRG